MTSELGKRVLTGLVGGTALLSLIIYGGWPGVFLLTAFLSVCMVFEYSSIIFSLPDRKEKTYLLMSLTWVIALLNLLIPRSEYAFLICSFFVLFAYFLITAKRHGEVKIPSHFRELMAALFGLIYLGFVPLFLPKLYELPDGMHWVVLFLLIVWAGDTGAYFVGRKFGRRKLYPEISPKKTLEGALGGLLAGIVATLFYKGIFFNAVPGIAVLILPGVIGIVAPMGDLCESLFKRAFNKKDSGSILPGHGGFLDRFDSVVFGLPVMYACVRVLI